MAVHLKKSVVAGGVVYPAGTAASPELRELIDDRHWTGEDSTDTAAYEQAIAELDTTLAERAATISTLEAQVAERDATIGELEAQVAELRTKVDELTEAQPTAAAPKRRTRTTEA